MTPYENNLLELFRNNKSIVVITAENRAFLRNIIPFLGDRFIDVGICEQNMIGIASGLAMRGKIVITHALANFLIMRPFEFIRTLVSFQNCNIKLIAAFPGILSEANGFTHQAIEDIALMRILPHMVVISPACSEDMGMAIKRAIEYKGPVYIRYNHISWSFIIDEELLPHEAAREKFSLPTGLSEDRMSVVSSAKMEIGKYQILRDGTDLYFITHGILTKQVLIAVEILEKKSISAGVIFTPIVLPVDNKVIIDAVKKCKYFVIVEDHIPTGGLKDVLCEILVNYQTSAKVIHIGIPPLGFQPALLKDVMIREKLDASSIALSVESILEERI